MVGPVVASGPVDLLRDGRHLGRALGRGNATATRARLRRRRVAPARIHGSCCAGATRLAMVAGDASPGAPGVRMLVVGRAPGRARAALRHRHRRRRRRRPGLLPRAVHYAGER